MASEMRFDGQVAIVTGAGGRPSLGRAYAHLLASRGAKVVVNDLGVGPDGRGVQRAHADAVTKEINDAGGEAVSDTNSVAGEESAKAVVQTAIDAWGRVDILVNNAGVAILAEIDEISPTDVDRVVQAHLLGNIWMSRAVWPHMRAAGYGRIVCITSGAVLGTRYVSVYGAAKGGILALSRGLAVEGRHHGIKVNALSPTAATIALAHLSDGKMMELAPPAEQVAPTVAFLAHPDCEHSGGWFEAGGGRTAYRFIAETEGYENPSVTLEDIRDNFEAIIDTTEHAVLPGALDSPFAEAIERKPYQPA